MTSARPSAALQPPADTRRIGRIRSETISTAAIFALTIILILASRFVSPALGSWDQVDTIITLASFLIVVAFGQGLVILVGGLDLSIASMITLGGVLATTWNGSLGSEWVVIPAVLVLCGCIGALNAVGVIWLNIPPFIMTMASGIIVASAALGYTSGTPRGAAPDAFLALMKGSVGRLSAVLIFVVIFVLLAWTLQGSTAFGRRLYAVGAEPRGRAHRGRHDMAPHHGRLRDQRRLRGLRRNDAGRLRERRDFAHGRFLPFAEHRFRRHRRIINSGRAG